MYFHGQQLSFSQKFPTMEQGRINPNNHELNELGRLYFERGDIRKAIQLFETLSNSALESRDYHRFLETAHVLLRLYAEREDLASITTMKEILNQLISQGLLIPNSRTFYTLGLCAVFNQQYEPALGYLHAALQQAMEQQNNEDLGYALFGLASAFRDTKRFKESMALIQKLEVVLEVLNIRRLKYATHVLKSNLFREQGDFQKALESLGKANDVIREEKSLFYHIHTQRFLGRIYKDMGQKTFARMYLEIALKTTDPQELVHTYNGIQKDLQGLHGDAPEHADLVIHSDFQVREKVRGTIEFKNQQTLQNLLRLFIENPGRIFTKEELIGKIWGEEYNPSVHDNKIYVTIKRLRHLIEPELDHPRYIFRSKNGYFFNKEAKIEIRG